MKKLTQLTSLKQITDAQYAIEQAAFQTLLAEEAMLRAELAKLKEMLLNVRTASLAPSEMRAIGADVLWQGWIGRSQTTLNINLARVLALKEFRQQEVRTSFGKAEIVNSLMKKAQSSQHQKNKKNQLETAINQALKR